MFAILIVVMIPWVHTNVKMDQVVRFKYVQFIACQLYVNKAVFKMYFIV